MRRSKVPLRETSKRLSLQLGSEFTKPEDWYTLKKVHLQKNPELLKFVKTECSSSIQKAAKKIFPNYSFESWKFARPPKETWNDVSNHYRLFEWVASRLQIKDIEDWYRVTLPELKSNGADDLLRVKYGYNHLVALLTLYPEFSWNITRFKSVSRSFWKDLDNQKFILDWIATQMRIKDSSDWYRIEREDYLANSNLRFLLRKFYNSSLPNALSKVYPNEQWQAWRFYKRPHAFWSDLEHQREFIRVLEKELKIEHLDDWYKITPSQVRKRGGAGLLNHYAGSLLRALEAVYPDHKWLCWKFAVEVSPSQKAIHKKFFDTYALRNNIREYEDWYNVKVADVKKSGGANVILHYNNSLVKAILNIYPEYNWQVWKFDQAPSGYWSVDSNVRQYLDWLGNKLCIRNLDDWKSVSQQDLEEHKGIYVTRINGGLKALLERAFPEKFGNENNDDVINFFPKSQPLINRMVMELFPEDTIHVNYRGNNIYGDSAYKFPLEVSFTRKITEFSLTFQSSWISTFHPFHLQSSIKDINTLKQRLSIWTLQTTKEEMN